MVCVVSARTLSASGRRLQAAVRQSVNSLRCSWPGTFWPTPTSAIVSLAANSLPASSSAMAVESVWRACLARAVRGSAFRTNLQYSSMTRRASRARLKFASMIL